MAMWWSMNECVLISATLSPKLMFFLVAMTTKTSHESQLHKHRAPAPKKRKEKKLGFLRGDATQKSPYQGEPTAWATEWEPNRCPSVVQAARGWPGFSAPPGRPKKAMQIWYIWFLWAQQNFWKGNTRTVMWGNVWYSLKIGGCIKSTPVMSIVTTKPQVSKNLNL